MPINNNFLGPDPARGGTATRPARVTAGDPVARWFGRCLNNADPNKTKITADFLNDQLAQDRELIASSGVEQVEGPSGDKMRAEAMARYASGGIGYQDSGVANAYILSSSSGSDGFVMPKSYFQPMMVMFRVGSSNTGSSVINVNGIGSKAIKRENGAALVSGELVAGQLTALEYDGVNFRVMPWANALNLSGAVVPAGQSRVVQIFTDREIADYVRASTTKGAVSKAYSITQRVIGSKCVVSWTANMRIQNTVNGDFARGRGRIYRHDGSAYVDSGAGERMVAMRNIEAQGSADPYLEGSIAFTYELAPAHLNGAGQWQLQLFGNTDNVDHEMTIFNQEVQMMEVVHG